MNLQKGKLRILGPKADVERASEVLSNIEGLKDAREAQARLIIQDAISENHLKATILYDGNTVYDMDRILNNLKQIIERGTLYDGNHPGYIPIGSLLRMPTIGETILSGYFYQFLTNCCGSIAHYSIRGWVTEYPTVDDLKKFFEKNEYGKPVREWIPSWRTDAKRIVDETEKLLFPFKHYLKWRQEHAPLSNDGAETALPET